MYDMLIVKLSDTPDRLPAASNYAPKYYNTQMIAVFPNWATAKSEAKRIADVYEMRTANWSSVTSTQLKYTSGLMIVGTFHAGINRQLFGLCLRRHDVHYINNMSSAIATLLD